MNRLNDVDYMKLAIQAARHGQGCTYTNPMVGAVIVKDNQILATGYHKQFGANHAEIDTLNNLKSIDQAQGATMYVTLEPCSHFGETPPCCRRIVGVGIHKVVIGQKDPNPVVHENGIRFLREHHVEVVMTSLSKDVRNINQFYNFYFENQRPFITLKYASTLDGKLNQIENQRSIITGHEALKDANQIRQNYQAILIGEHTLKIDNPALTVRNDTNIKYPPVRILLVNNASSIVDSQIVNDKQAPVLILCHENDCEIKNNNVEVVEGRWTPERITSFLNEKGIQSILVEGGSRVQSDFIQAGLVDRVINYISPKLWGGQSLPVAYSKMDKLVELNFRIEDVQQIESDLKITADRQEVPHV
ncbi:bifunctional diaminohydroxyphosphoribosylaminopyrimidine deaminase/5-amino-6-(5-phosphoribosylamino)uracil reductase RibD [Pediococcus argentinicus]